MLGLDIGSSAVKLVELSAHGQGFRLDSFAVEPIASGAVQDKGVHDVTAVAAAIRRAVSQAGTRQRQVVAAVGGATAMTKVITMPAGLNDLELEEQVALEASQSISYPLDEVNLDFEVLGPTASGDRMEVLLAASRTDQVNNHTMAVEMAGLELRILDIEAYALENAFPLYTSLLPELGKGKTVAVVDVGHRVTTLVVLHDGSGIYQQSQGFGCQQLLDNLRAEADMQSEEAMRHLRQGRLTEQQQQDILLPFRDAAVRQVHRMLQLFQSSGQASPLDYILLSGGAALLPELTEGVARQTGTGAGRFEIVRPLDIAPSVNRANLQQLAPSLLVALGLGIRGVMP